MYCKFKLIKMIFPEGNVHANHKSTWRTFVRIWQHTPLNRRNQLIGLLALMLLASFAEVISIGAVLPFLKMLNAPLEVFNSYWGQKVVIALNLQSTHELLLFLTLVFVLAVLFANSLRLSLMWMQTRLSYSVGVDFSVSIYEKVLYQPYPIHIKTNSGEFIAGLTAKAGALLNHGIMPVLNLISSTLILLVLLGTLLSLKLSVAIFAFLCFGLIYFCVIKFTKNKLAKDSRMVSIESVKVLKTMQEGLGGIRDVLLDGTQQIYTDIYRTSYKSLQNSSASIQLISSSPRFAIETLGMVLIALIAYFLSGDETSTINQAIPLLGAVALGAQRLLPVLQQIYSSWTAIQGGQSSMWDALNLLDQPINRSHSERVLSFEHSIAFNGVQFQYSSDLPYVIRDVNLVINKGEKVGFIGATGSGKSTVLDLLMGLLSPSNGGILIDGKNLTTQNIRGWQDHIAHVPQSIYLSDASIAENIAFGTPRNLIDYDLLERASREASIHDAIMKMPNRYETIVGERGVRLSGGQRQRIGIARALYKRADVLILDEATSALDGATEAEVMSAIEGLSSSLTMVIVAHRLTTLRQCSRIYMLENGEIKRVMTYQELCDT